VRQVAAYVSLLFMILGAMVFLAGLCALVSGIRPFVVPFLLIGLVVLIVASAVRWRTATG